MRRAEAEVLDGADVQVDVYSPECAAQLVLQNIAQAGPFAQGNLLAAQVIAGGNIAAVIPGIPEVYYRVIIGYERFDLP
jgi:hypothetical protein